MAEDNDGMNDAVEGHLRIAVTLAARAAEVLAQIVAERAREAAAASEAEGRRLSARLDAERAAARAAVEGVGAEQWWARAQPEQIADAWQVTQTWKEIDPDLARKGREVAAQLQARYGIDVEQTQPDPQALREAMAAREAAQQDAGSRPGTASREDLEAVLLVAEADAADRSRQPERVQQVEPDAEVAHDSAARRQELAAQLEKIASPDAVQARMLADASHSKPARDAVNGKTSIAGPRRVAPREPGLAGQRIKTLGR